MTMSSSLQLPCLSTARATRHRLLASVLAVFGACGGGDAAPVEVHDPETAAQPVVDRFAAGAGTLMVRTEANGLPAAGAAIDFDAGPMITRGLGPDGAEVQYYNFDVQPAAPADIYVLFPEGGEAPVAGQLNIIDAIPGDPGYSDFWRVTRVDVPADYVANTIASVDELEAAGFEMTQLDMIVNCPVVPPGSTATRRVGGGSSGLHQGWYRAQLVHYFTFEEAALDGAAGFVPQSPIYVTFNINPDQEGGGPPSGFVVEDAATGQTHNVLGSLPGDAGYSPLWSVSVYDNADFDAVADLASIDDASVLAANVMAVNCPLAAM